MMMFILGVVLALPIWALLIVGSMYLHDWVVYTWNSWRIKREFARIRKAI